MNAGKESEKSEFQLSPSRHTQVKVVAASKTLTNPLKKTSTQTNKFTSTANSSVKAKSTTSTVSKITKLVLKPKSTTAKCSVASKGTTNKYTIKPVTIKSRSTVISHESTFRIRNIKKSPPNKRQSAQNAAISVKSEQISHQLIVNTEHFNENNMLEAKKPFEMVHSEQSANITSLNVTKTVDSPILQEITSAVVNGTSVVKSPVKKIAANISNSNKENQNSRQKTAKHCENDLECKSKSYDPIKARQFIQQQKEKWKEAEKNENVNKAPASKEEIRQRLNALRKNTLKIVEKNVQKARKSVQPVNTKKFTPKKSAEPPKTSADKKLVRPAKQTPDLRTPQSQLPIESKITPSLALTPSKFLPTIKSKKNRIGILRRPEGDSPTLEPTSIAAQTSINPSINNTHRNSNDDLIASPEKTVQNRESSSFRRESNQYELGLIVPETVPLKSTLLGESAPSVEQSWHQNEQNSWVGGDGDGDRDRDRDTDVHNSANETSVERITPKKDIPFWLRPTPVQPYPYNFIMAVRKKLESIAHPVFPTRPQHHHHHPQEQQQVFEPQQQQQPEIVEQPSYQSPIARPDARFMSQYRRYLDRRTSESESMSEHIKSSDTSPVKTSNEIEHIEEQEEQREQEEYSMDFSSVTMESRPNQSKILSKPKPKNVRASQDTLSISSDILSHSSPEKKPKTTISNRRKDQKDDELRQPSPLTTDNVDGLQITSHSLSHNERTTNGTTASDRHSIPSARQSHQSIQSSFQSTRPSVQESSIATHINFGRGNDYSRSSQPSLRTLSKQKSVEELLLDFTNSLSQVIEVNQRLHKLLSNPPTSRSKYSDDFEHATHNKQSAISEHITETRDSTSVPSYKTTLQTSSVHRSDNQYTNNEDANGNTTEDNRIEISHSNTSSAHKTVAESSGNIISNEMSILSSTRNPIKSSYSMEIEESLGKQDRSATEPSSHIEKESTTLIDEKINEYPSSESPTNNDLKSITLSIAKKSAATSDDTDQPSNAIESFSKQIIGEPEVANESIGSDIFNIFNKTSMHLGDDINTSIWSEHNISYSTLGMCDQLLKSETRKSEDLTSLLKMREKALIDRFKGQIAWLELQKQKLKENGHPTEISMIKKKQRALLLRLNNDRKELHRLLKEHQQSNAAENASNVNFNISHMTTNMSIRRTSVSKRINDIAPKRALKAIELPGGGMALEIMLQKRENELRRRREHVEKLLKWHQRLDIEEQEVIKMEQMIMFISTSDVYQTTSHEQINDTVAITVHHRSKRTNCQSDEQSANERSLTNVTDTITMEKTRFEHKKQKQIHKIEKSLNTLKMISSRSISSDIDGSNADESVEIYGRQLNKLWKRLTGEYEEKYTPEKVYTLSKYDLELMYEQAKSVVIKKFHANEEFKRRLIDNSMSIIDGNQNNSISLPQLSEKVTHVEKTSEPESIVPALNLASSPEPRENIISDTDQGYYFSNSNVDISSKQEKQTPETVVAPPTTSDATSHSLDGSQIQTEEQIEEDDPSTSLQDDVQSDITEDSLNRPKQSSNEDVSPSEIKTISQTNGSNGNESGKSTQIQSVIETSHSSIPFALNTTGESTQLIEETSFPNIDVQTTISSVAEDISVVSQNSLSPVKYNNASSQPSEEQKYHTDDFEEGEEKSADELTSISTETVTKIPTTTITNQSSDKSLDKSVEKSTEKTIEISTEQISTPSDELPKELEQRLILIDDGLRELSETISQSPVFHRESQHTNESNEDEQSTGTKSPSSDGENKSEEGNKSAESVESVESVSEKTTDNEMTTESNRSAEHEPSVVNDSPKVDSDESTDSIAAEIAVSKIDHQTPTESLSPKRPFQYTLSAGSIDYNKVPEADALKRSQVPLETELKKAEQSSAIFPVLREIPNKPPPPYPVHRQLPQTPPFPSDERISEIVYRRIEELYEKPSDSLSGTPIRCDATFVKSPTLSITSPDSPAAQDDVNVFERIIIHCCDEIMQEISAPEKQPGGVFRQPLGFFNPPNRLKCYQAYALKRIFKLLNRPQYNDAVAGSETKTFIGMRSFLPSQVAQLTFNNRRKRDTVDEILIHELYEDEARWTNFDLEEKEIRESVPDLRTLLVDESSEIHETSVNASTTEQTNDTSST